MTSRKKSAGIGLLSVGLLAGTASAYEPGVHEATRSGVTLGIPAGAAPPPGVYLNLNTFFYGANVVDRFGNNTGFHDNTASSSALLMLVPGWQALGASFYAYAVQPYVFNATTYEPAAPPCATGNCSVRNVTGFHNTLISPFNLSWSLGNGLFTAIGFGFYAPDGTVAAPKYLLPPTAGTGGPGLDYWTFQPRWAVSYVGNDYNLTANLFYEFNTKNRYSQYTSGDMFYGDFTATKKYGKWTVGPVAALLWQTSSDSDPLGLYPSPPYDPLNDRRSKQISVGGLLGYDLGAAQLNIILTKDVYARNTGDGMMVQGNLSFKLWSPEAPPPKLINK